SGHVFVWPATSKLLIVDVDHTLLDGVEALASGGNAAPTLREGAALALQSLNGKYKVVYLSAAVRDPASYKKFRSWLQQAANQIIPGTAMLNLPPGPLLAPSEPIGDADEKVFMASQIELLKKQFTEPAVCIAGRDTEARTFLDA